MKRSAEEQPEQPPKHSPEPQCRKVGRFFDLAEAYCKMIGCTQHAPQDNHDISAEMKRQESVMRAHGPIVRIIAIHESAEHNYYNVRAEKLSDDMLDFVIELSAGSFTSNQHSFEDKDGDERAIKLRELGVKAGIVDRDDENGKRKKPELRSINPEGHVLLATVMACTFC
jgi:hypothetical protein